MKPEFWLTQTKDKPLFPELEWSRPENRMHAGKLLIIGGNLHGFAAPAEAYAEAVKAGIGVAHVLLPEAVRKIVGPIIENGEFAPSTPTSGSFSQKALNDLLIHANWADGILVAGDLGRNSETAVLLEKFLEKSPLAMTITKDAVDYITSAPHAAVDREDTLLVLSFSQLQRLGIAAKFTRPLTFSMDLLHLVDWLHGFTLAHKIHLIVKHHDQLCVAVNGQVSTIRTSTKEDIWRVTTAAHASVWWLQNVNKPFEALTVAVRDAMTNA